MRLKFASTPKKRATKGAAAVEFALLVPILLLLIFGIISYGYMLSFRQNLSQAAAEGARSAAVTIAGTTPQVREDLAEQAVEEALSSYGLECGANSLTCEITATKACAPNLCAEVTLSYDYEARPLTPDLPLLGIVMPNTLSYTANAQVSQ